MPRVWRRGGHQCQRDRAGALPLVPELPFADSRINNGASPDAVAPFMVPQEHAIEIIRGFVEERKFYAHPRFKREFAPENVVGVYLPYFVFDGNVRASLTGQGEVRRKVWTEKHGDSVETYYSADRLQRVPRVRHEHRRSAAGIQQRAREHERSLTDEQHH